MIFRSLQARLIALTMLVFMLAIGCTSAMVLLTGQRQINRDYDSQLIADAHVLWHMLREDLTEGDKIGEVTAEAGSPSLEASQLVALTSYTQWRAFRIWRQDKLVAWTHAKGLPDKPQAQAGFSQVILGSSVWLVYTLLDPAHGLTVEAWEKLENRQKLLGGILAELLVPGLILVPVLLIVLLLVIRFSLGDIGRLSRKIQLRHRDNITPIVLADLPIELQPVLQSLNELLERLQQGLVRERHLLDSTAHELRTPLAALKLQAQLVAGAPDEPQRQLNIVALEAGIERTAKLVSQLLILARLDGQNIERTQLNLGDVLREVITAQALVAHQKDTSLSLEGPVTEITANKELFYVLVSTLLENAIKYSPPGSAVIVRSRADGFEIEDNGLGIPAEAHEQAFSRFGRLDRIQTGTGLGLSIAREISEAHGWKISLTKPATGQGLLVVISF